MKLVKTVRLRSVNLTKKKYEEIAHVINCFKESVNFLINKCIENPIFKNPSNKGNGAYDYSSYPKIRKNFYFEWKSRFPDLHTHYCHSSARITKDILKSWNSWCFKEKNRLPNPKYKKNSMKVEGCLCYLKENYVILVIEPRSKLYIPYEPNEYFKRVKTNKYGEITLKMNTNRKVDIFIPFITAFEEKQPESILGIDTNERSIDMLFLANDRTEFMSIDVSGLSTTHYTYSLKRKQIAKKITNGKKYQPKTKRNLLNKYGKREKNKCKDLLHKLTNQILDVVEKNKSIVILEDLTDIRNSVSRKKNSKRMRRRLNRWNFRQFQTYLEYKTNRTGFLVSYQNPSYTSRRCMKCEKTTESKSHKFVCKYCGFRVNRHFQATFNIVNRFIEHQDVASSDSAERYRMKMMAGELRKFKESVIGDASQYDRINGINPLLSP